MRRYLTKLLRNTPYKLASVFLATLLWYIVQGEEILDINRRLIVKVQVPEGFMLKGDDERVKDVTLRGPRVLLGNYDTKPLEATLIIPEGVTGQRRILINRDIFGDWDNRIKLTVHDPYLTLVVDEEMTRRVAVKEFLKGVPADGYIIEKVSIKPSRVKITGLRGEISRLSEVRTEPIDVDGLQKSKSFEVDLVPNGFTKDGLETSKVNVSIAVGEKKENKRLSAIPVEVVGSEFITAVKPREVSIVIQGTPGVLNFVKRSDLEAFVEARELAPGKKYTRDIQVKIPPNTVLIETFPEKANLEIYNQKRLN
jgi:hypothetical protein